jgi:hypothetical protein
MVASRALFLVRMSTLPSYSIKGCVSISVGPHREHVSVAVRLTLYSLTIVGKRLWITKYHINSTTSVNTA